MKNIVLLVCIFISFNSLAQQKGIVYGRITSDLEPVEEANIILLNSKIVATSDSLGYFKIENLSEGNYKLQVSAMGFESVRKTISIKDNQQLTFNFDLKRTDGQLNEVVVSGTLKAVKRLESPVPVEVYSPVFFKKNPTPSIYEALQNVNGVRPQLNCGVCNTGDIHINGLEGPYTLVLIDGMPIVSSLSTVYGLSGIPNSLVERIEIVKGPASSLYGSEAVGGLINIITKNPVNAPFFSADFFTVLFRDKWLNSLFIYLRDLYNEPANDSNLT